VANLGAAIAGRHVPVVLVDLDPQANLTTHLGLECGPDRPSVYDIFSRQVGLGDVLADAGDHLRLAPSSIDLAAAEVELAAVTGREIILREALDRYSQPYEFMLIDCPPSLGVLTVNALSAVDDVIITLQTHFLALQGFGKLLETVNLVARRINHRLRVRAIALCMYESGTRLANEVVADVNQFIESTRLRNSPWSDAVVFTTRIRRNIKLAEAPSYGMDIFRYAPASHGAKDYLALSRELLSLYGWEQVDAHVDAEAEGGTTERSTDENIQLEHASKTESVDEADRDASNPATIEDPAGNLPDHMGRPDALA